jgi:hypothetical protein
VDRAGRLDGEASRAFRLDPSRSPWPVALVNGRKNPTLDTLWRYAAPVSRRLVLTNEAIRGTRPAQAKVKRVRAAPEI